MLLVPVASAQTGIAGVADAASFELEDSGFLEAEAYLVGFRTNGRDESAYQWTFRADEVLVRLEKQHYTGDIVPVPQGNTTQERRHEDAAGVLLERLPLSYLMAVSARPDDPAASYGLDMDLPVDSLEVRHTIAFSTEFVAEDDEVLPGVNSDNEHRREYHRPWSNLGHDLPTHDGVLSLHGNFTIHVFDVTFQIRDGAGESTVYNATYGGARGDDVPSPVHEYNTTVAKLQFTNATFTLLPSGRPLQVNLQSATTQVHGVAHLSDVQGKLYQGDVETALDGSLVKLDAADLRLDVRPKDAPTSRFDLAFEGFLAGAIVDGRIIDLDEANHKSAPGDVAPGTTAVRDTGNLWSVWLLVWAAGAAVMGMMALTVAREYQARMNPEYVTRRGQSALEEGRITRARALAKRVLRHHPHESEAVALGAMLHAQRKQTREMLAFLDPYLFGPADEGGALSILYCVGLLKEEGMENARAFLRRAAKKKPGIWLLVKEYPEFDFYEMLAEDVPRDDSASYM